MSTRPLRQYYDQEVSLDVEPALGPVIEPWLGHRRRFLDDLTGLTDDEWLAPTRCDDWNARDLVSHLITVDGFWVASLTAARHGQPTTYLPGFDPSGTPELLVVPMRELSTGELLDQFAAGQAAFVDTVEAFGPDDWAAPGESPVGHVPARLVLAHAFWDSWVHERDLAEPAGPRPVDPDELFIAAWYSLFLTCAQGGLIGDDQPVGPGLGDPIDVEVGFDDLPDRVVRVMVGSDLRIGPGADATAVVSAMDLVDSCTGRSSGASSTARLPVPLRDHMARGRDVLVTTEAGPEDR